MQPEGNRLGYFTVLNIGPQPSYHRGSRNNEQYDILTRSMSQRNFKPSEISSCVENSSTRPTHLARRRPGSGVVENWDEFNVDLVLHESASSRRTPRGGLYIALLYFSRQSIPHGRTEARALPSDFRLGGRGCRLRDTPTESFPRCLRLGSTDKVHRSKKSYVTLFVL